MLFLAKTLLKLCACWVLISAASGQQESSFVQQQGSLQTACEAELKTFCHVTNENMYMLGTESTVCLRDHHDELGTKCLAQLDGPAGPEGKRRLEVKGRPCDFDQNIDQITTPVISAPMEAT